MLGRISCLCKKCTFTAQRCAEMGGPVANLASLSIAAFSNFSSWEEAMPIAALRQAGKFVAIIFSTSFSLLFIYFL